MKRFKNNERIVVLGAIFNGVEDIMLHERNGEPKNGVYVGADCKCYPCFDSSDWLYENRRYWNFVFAESKEELAGKLALLNKSGLRDCNYNKLTEKLHPMAYWEGDTMHDLFLTEGKGNDDLTD